MTKIGKIMTKKLLLALLLFNSSMVASHAAADVGYVVIEEIYAKSTVIKELRASVSGQFQAQDDALRAKFQSFQEKVEQFEKDEVLLSDEEKQTKQQELLQLQQTFQQESQALNEVVGKAITEMQQKIDPEVSRIIEMVAKSNDVKLVVNGLITVPLNNQTIPRSVVLYSEDEVNLTGQVIELFDKEASVQ